MKPKPTKKEPRSIAFDPKKWELLKAHAKIKGVSVSNLIEQILTKELSLDD